MAYKYETKLGSNHSARSGFADHSKGSPDTLMIHHWGNDGQSHDNVVAWLRGAAGGTTNTKSSAHLVTSAGRVTRVVPDNRAAWHCVGRNGGTIGIECRPEMSAGDWQTLVELCADLEEDHSKSFKYDYHGNNAATTCPGRYKPKMAQLVRDVNDEHKRRKTGKAPAKPKPKPASPAKPKPAAGSYTGPSVVEYLQSVRQDASYANRARLAQRHGISNYRGTAAQNTALLRALRSGGATPKSVATMATEVIAGKHGNGHAERRASLGVNAKTYAAVRELVNKRLR